MREDIRRSWETALMLFPNQVFLIRYLEIPDKKTFTVPPDILAALKANATAWQNFQRFPPAYVRIRIGYIEGARKRPDEFAKRLGNFVRMTERNRRFGFGGIEKHYDRA